MSQTARVALRGSGKETTPTDVANLGTNRIVAEEEGHLQLSTEWNTRIENFSTFGDNPKCAFCADEQLSEIEPRGTLPSPLSRLYYLTRGKNCGLEYDLLVSFLT